MDLNKLFKAIVIAAPLLALGACSSTSESETDASGSTTSGSEYGNGAGGVEIGGANPVLSRKSSSASSSRNCVKNTSSTLILTAVKCKQNLLKFWKPTVLIWLNILTYAC